MAAVVPGTSPRCVPKQKKRRANKPLSLPVLPSTNGHAGGSGSHAHNAWQKGHPKIAHSKIGKWRAAVLILVHVLIAIHIAHWIYAGSTISPVEPSESMQTLREGLVNAGFVFFALAILSTFIFGRFFCGWACHIVALQDLSAWGMMKLGVHPKPFRSRLLIYAPLGIALYMFVWPVFHREVIRRFFADETGRLPTWLGQSEPLPIIKSEFFVDDFWATFPDWYVAIPFFLVIGFFAVYFLGAKGFCTYGCPYGGFFAPLDKLAPGRIRVNDNCNHCGHCTAVCTSNVRVHEEVRDFGKVMDVGCMKCLDCISVCPNDALRFGFSTPAKFSKPRKDADPKLLARAKASREARYDLSRKEEWAMGLAFLAMFLAFRGMFNAIPMLMAGGIAGLGVMLLHKSHRLLRDPSVRFQHHQLKAKGKWRIGGFVVAALTIILVLAGAWSGFVRYHVWRGNALYATMNTPMAVALRPDYAPSPSQTAIARRAISHYTRGRPINEGAGAGGVGWGLTPDEMSNMAYLHAVLGDLDGAQEWFDRVVESGEPRDSLIFQIADLMRARGRPTGEIDTFTQRALEQHPKLDLIRNQLALAQVELGRKDDALTYWKGPLEDEDATPGIFLGAAATSARLGDTQRALGLLDRLLERSAKHHHEEPEAMLSAARLYLALQKPDKAREAVNGALAFKTNRGHIRAAAAVILAQLGDATAAKALAREAAKAARDLGPHSGKASTLQNAGTLLFQLGERDEGAAMLAEAVRDVRHSPWDLAGLGVALGQLGLSAQSPALVKTALEAFARARELQPDSPTLAFDAAQLLFASGSVEEGLKAAESAATAAPENAALAENYAALLNYAGRTDDAARWQAEAARRRTSR